MDISREVAFIEEAHSQPSQNRNNSENMDFREGAHFQPSENKDNSEDIDFSEGAHYELSENRNQLYNETLECRPNPNQEIVNKSNMNETAMTNVYDDCKIMAEESNSLQLQTKFKNMDKNTDILEKFKKLERLYERSEKLRLLMKNRHKKKYDRFQYVVKKLQQKIRILEEKDKGIKIESLIMINY